MYVSYILMVFLVSFYGFLVPSITPIVFMFFLILYWVDKYNAFKRSSLDSFEDDRGDLIMAILLFSVFLSTLSYFIWDLNIQKEPKIKPLNIVCIFLTFQFAAFDLLIGIQTKAKLFEYDENDVNAEKLRFSYE